WKCCRRGGPSGAECKTVETEASMGAGRGLEQLANFLQKLAGQRRTARPSAETTRSQPTGRRFDGKCWGCSH
ncbi:MAG: hypothetical protein ACP5R4_05575, partial [Armatimonadota bacterium]